VLEQELAEVSYGITAYITGTRAQSTTTTARAHSKQQLTRAMATVEEPLDFRVCSLIDSVAVLESCFATLACATLSVRSGGGAWARGNGGEGGCNTPFQQPITADVSPAYSQEAYDKAASADSRVLELQQKLHKTAWASAKARCSAIKQDLDNQFLLQKLQNELKVVRGQRETFSKLLLKFHAASAPLVARFKSLHELALFLQDKGRMPCAHMNK
jgi:hypothetical protein